MTKPWFYTTAVALDAGGGQTTRVIEHCRVLAARVPVHLFAPQPPPLLPDLPYTQVAIPHHPPRDAGFQLRLARALIRQGRQTPPQLIYTYAGSTNLGPWIAARSLGCPLVLELHGLHALEYGLEHQQTALLRLRQMIYATLFRLDMRLADGVVAVTEQLADYAQQRGARRVLVAPNGVNPQRFGPVAQDLARQRTGLPAAAFVVGFVGNLAGWQGLDTLLQGVALARQGLPEIKVLMIGTGSQEHALHALAEQLDLADTIIWAGRVPYAEVAALLSAADLLVGPFAANPRNAITGVSPLKIFEYLALERPLLLSDLPGLEFIAKHGAGLLFQANDPVDLARKLRAVAALGSAAQHLMGRTARQLAETHYAWEQINQQIMDFVQTLLLPGESTQNHHFY